MPDPHAHIIRFDDVAARVLTTPPRCGATRLVCVDGPSGSGKTVLAARLARALADPPLVHMDDLYPGWDGLAAAVDLLDARVVAQLGAGRPARCPRYDWHRGRYAEERDLGTPPLLVVEGAGSGARVVAAAAVLLIWVAAPADVRRRRGIARDGEAYRPHWDRWAAQERDHFAAEHTRRRADLHVDGAPTLPHDPERELVVHPGHA